MFKWIKRLLPRGEAGHSAETPKAAEPEPIIPYEITPEYENWLAVVPGELSEEELGRGIIFCDEAADRLAEAHEFEQALDTRIRVLELVEFGESNSDASPDWVPALKQKQWAQAAVDCGRLAEPLQEVDDVKALEWWSKGVRFLHKASSSEGDRLQGFAKLHRKQLLEAALTSRRVALATMGDDELSATEYFDKSAQFFTQALRRFPDQREPWVERFHETTLRRAANGFRRIASDTKTADGTAALPFWEKSLRLYEVLVKHYPEQPDRIIDSLEGVLREAAIANRAVAIESKDENKVLAAEYWEKAAGQFGKLFSRYPKQPHWVSKFQETSLRGGATASHSLARSLHDQGDPSALSYWRQSAYMFGQLLKLYPDQPDWVFVRLERACRELGGESGMEQLNDVVNDLAKGDGGDTEALVRDSEEATSQEAVRK